MQNSSSSSSSSGGSLLVCYRIKCGGGPAGTTTAYFELLGRRVTVPARCASTQRWVDVCLTRDEALVADNKLSVQIAPFAQQQQQQVTICTHFALIRSF